MRGRFIVVEGPDGVGTTTQAAAVANALEQRGRRTHVTAEPSKGAIGQLVRARLKHEGDKETLALLFAADRLDHWHGEVRPQLDAGVDVVSDRYVLSSLVYQ